MKILVLLLALLLMTGGGLYWMKFARVERIHIAGNAFRFDFQSLDGTDLPLSQFRGKAVLVVNTASRCGFTPQYDGLEKLWTSYRGKGLVVLGVPSNDFQNQEPGTAKEIKEFCDLNFNVDFPMTEKVHVTGADAHPFYQWIKAQSGSQPLWNFHKYLIAPDGSVVGSFPSAVKPQSARMIHAIEAVLPTS